MRPSTVAPISVLIACGSGFYLAGFAGLLWTAALLIYILAILEVAVHEVTKHGN